MQTFKKGNLYLLACDNYHEWVSCSEKSASIQFVDFRLYHVTDDFVQCPESEYLRVRNQALHFLNEMRPKVTGASLYLNETVSPQTAE